MIYPSVDGPQSMSANPREPLVVPPFDPHLQQEEEEYPLDSGARPRRDGDRKIPRRSGDDTRPRRDADNKEPSSWAWALFPKTGFGAQGAYDTEFPTSFTTREVEQTIILDGNPAGTLTIAGYDAEQLGGWSATSGIGYGNLSFQMHNGRASDVVLTVSDPTDPTRQGSGVLSWDIETLEAEIAGPIGRLAYAKTVYADLLVGAGYYQMKLKPTSTGNFVLPGKTYYVGSFPTGFWVTDPPSSGAVALEEQTLTGFFGEVGLGLGVRIWRGLEASATVAERFYAGAAEAMQTRLTLSVGWSF